MKKLILPYAACVLSLLLSGPSLRAAQPQVIGVSPSSGGGTGATFSMTVSDSDGAADISGINLLFGSAILNGTNACWIYFDPAHRTASLADDSGLQWNDISLDGTSRTQNSQCSVRFVSANDSGNMATVTFDVQFIPGSISILTIRGRGGDLAGADSGYQSVGQYQIIRPSAPDFTVSVSNATQSVTAGHTATYNFTVTSLNGLSGAVNNSFSYTGSSTLDTAANQIGGPLMLPAGGSVTGSFQVTTGSDTPAGTLNVTDALSVGSAMHSVQVALGVNPASTPDISVSPSSGGGGNQTFTVTVNDPGGFAAIRGFHLLLNSSLDTRNSCWLYFERAPNWLDGRGTLYLASDDTTPWSGIAPNVIGGSLQNSQCSVFGGPFITSAGGNTLTVAIPLNFFAGFAGNRNIYGEVTDNSGFTTGYQAKGQWTAAAGSIAGQPDFQITLFPAGNDTLQPTWGLGHAVVVTRSNGFSETVDFTVTGTPPGSTLTPVRSVTDGPGDSSYLSITTSSSTPPGVYPVTITGTSGTLTHSVVLQVTVLEPGLPTLSMSPASGSGSPETFSFNATDASAPANVTGLNILFGSAVDGRNACWIYQDGNQVWLASDDGLLWSHTDATTGRVENSQCKVAPVSLTQPAYALSLVATITFKGGFTGAKTVYMNALNKQGRSTGYVARGTWTLP